MNRKNLHIFGFLLILVSISIKAGEFDNEPVSVALDNTDYQFSATLFNPVTDDFTKGDSSMRSRFFNLLAPQVEVLLSGDVTVIFDYKFIKGNYQDGKFYFEVYGQFGPMLSKNITTNSTNGWKTAKIYIPSGAESANWILEQIDASTIASLDNVRIVAGDQTLNTGGGGQRKDCNADNPFFDNELSKAVDNTLFNFVTDQGFINQSSVSRFGSDAAQSVNVPPGQFVFMNTGIQAAVSFDLSFEWKVSSLTNVDGLIFELLDENFNAIASKTRILSGEIDWEKVTVEVPSGIHYPVWFYVKGQQGSAGQDRGWVDKVDIGGLLDRNCVTMAPIINLLFED